MSSTQLLRLATVLFAVLVLWGAVALASRRSDEDGERGRLLPDVDTSAIDTVALTGPGDTIILSRAEEGRVGWQVNGKPADTRAVAELLGALKAAPKAELVARNPASHARLRVTDDSATRLRVVQDTHTVVDLLAGKQSADWDGLYLRRTRDSAVYVIRGGLAPAVTRSAEDWRDHIIATISPDSVSAIEIRRGKRSYSLRRQDQGWVFGSGAAADSSAVSSLLGRYGEIRATGFGTKAQRDSLRGRWQRSVRLLDRQGDLALGLVFDSIASGTWVRVSDGPSDLLRAGEAYRIDNWTADQLTPADSTLRKR